MDSNLAVQKDLAQFLGVPVLVQMKFPLGVPMPVVGSFSHASSQDRQWVPMEMPTAFDEATGEVVDPTPVVRELIPYAVIQWIDPEDDLFEMRWLVPIGGKTFVVSTIAKLSDAVITRLVETPPVPPAPEPKRLVTL